MMDVLPFIESEVVCRQEFYITEPFSAILSTVITLIGLAIVYIMIFTGVMPRP